MKTINNIVDKNPQYEILSKFYQRAKEYSAKMSKSALYTGIAAAVALPVLYNSNEAEAQMVCSERDKFLKHLGGDQYKEAPVAMGLASNGSVLEVLASKEGDTWTIILTMPNGTSCVVASGEAWEDLKDKIPLGPKT